MFASGISWIRRTAPVIALLFAATGAEAALLRITPQGVAVPDQVVTDPVPIASDGFRFTYHGGGDKTLVDPVLLIIATVQGSTASAPGVSFSGASNVASMSVTTTVGGTNRYGGTWNTTTGSAGVYNAASAGANNSVYELIGFTPDGSDSQNYPNWTGASGKSAWDVWVYQLAFDPDLSRGQWVEFDTTELAAGSFVVGYGCTQLQSGLCKNPGATESTPFTFAGMVVSVPEPGTLALLAGGLLSLSGIRRSKARG